MLVLITLELNYFYYGQSDSVLSTIYSLVVTTVDMFDASDALLKPVGHC